MSAPASTLRLGDLTAADRAGWEPLACGYTLSNETAVLICCGHLLMPPL